MKNKDHEWKDELKHLAIAEKCDHDKKGGGPALGPTSFMHKKKRIRLEREYAWCDKCESIVRRCIICHKWFNDVQTIAGGWYAGLEVKVHPSTVRVCKDDFDRYELRGFLKTMFQRLVYSDQKYRDTPQFDVQFKLFESIIDEFA